jgi:hypothetical protein
MLFTMMPNMTLGATEETLSEAGIREMMSQSTRVEDTDPNFLYCIRVRQLNTHFCCDWVPLRRGLFIVCFVDVFIALYAAAMYIVPPALDNKIVCDISFIYHAVQALGFVPAMICLWAAKQLDTKKAKLVYHWKIWEPLIMDVLEVLLMAITHANGPENPGLVPLPLQILFTIAYCMLRAMCGVYVAFTLFSFYMILEYKGNPNLVLYGPDLVKLMMNIRKQAAAMEMRADTSELDIMTDPAVASKSPSEAKS